MTSLLAEDLVEQLFLLAQLAVAVLGILADQRLDRVLDRQPLDGGVAELRSRRQVRPLDLQRAITPAAAGILLEEQQVGGADAVGADEAAAGVHEAHGDAV